MSSSLRRQLADAHAQIRVAKDALHQVEYPLSVRIRELEAQNTQLRQRLAESRRELHAITVLARTIEQRCSSMTLVIENHTPLASGKDVSL